MEYSEYNISEQVDPAVDLGVIEPGLPDVVFFEDFCASPPTPPPQLIEGILHKGCKMLLGGTSKSNKSWCLLDMAICVAAGQPWWGRQCIQAPVVYVNFELQPWALAQRLGAICAARPEFRIAAKHLALWNLRGKNSDISIMRPQLEDHLTKNDFGMIIFDPVYKMLGDRDENANGEVAEMMNEFEGIAQRTTAATTMAHHFAKGDSTAKQAIDRMSGAGAWARDPDSIMVLTPHEEQDSFTVTSVLRNLPQLPEFCVSWNYPLMRLNPDLNPEALRRPQSKNKVCSDLEFVDGILTSEPQKLGDLVTAGKAKFGMSQSSVQNYLKRLSTSGLVGSVSGCYWAKK